MTILSGVGSSGSVGPTSGGKTYAYNNLGTASQLAAPANPSRVKVTFHNPGTVDVFICPAFIQNTGSNVALAATTAALGGTFRVYANGGDRVIEGECQGQWNAFAASGASNPLTVIDTNR